MNAGVRNAGESGGLSGSDGANLNATSIINLSLIHKHTETEREALDEGQSRLTSAIRTSAFKRVIPSRFLAGTCGSMDVSVRNKRVGETPRD